MSNQFQNANKKIKNNDQKIVFIRNNSKMNGNLANMRNQLKDYQIRTDLNQLNKVNHSKMKANLANMRIQLEDRSIKTDDLNQLNNGLSDQLFDLANFNQSLAALNSINSTNNSKSINSKAINNLRTQFNNPNKFITDPMLGLINPSSLNNLSSLTNQSFNLSSSLPQLNQQPSFSLNNLESQLNLNCTSLNSSLPNLLNNQLDTLNLVNSILKNQPKNHLFNKQMNDNILNLLDVPSSPSLNSSQLNFNNLTFPNSNLNLNNLNLNNFNLSNLNRKSSTQDNLDDSTNLTNISIKNLNNISNISLDKINNSLNNLNSLTNLNSNNSKTKKSTNSTTKSTNKPIKSTNDKNLNKPINSTSTTTPKLAQIKQPVQTKPQSTVLFVCNVCGEDLTSLEAFDEHERTRHPNVICSFSEADNHDLKFDQDKLADKTKEIEHLYLPINKANKKQSSTDNKKDHNGFNCTKCQKKFIDIDLFHEHILDCATISTDINSNKTSEIGKDDNSKIKSGNDKKISRSFNKRKESISDCAIASETLNLNKTSEIGKDNNSKIKSGNDKQISRSFNKKKATNKKDDNFAKQDTHPNEDELKNQDKSTIEPNKTVNQSNRIEPLKIKLPKKRKLNSNSLLMMKQEPEIKKFKENPSTDNSAETKAASEKSMQERIVVRNNLYNQYKSVSVSLLKNNDVKEQSNDDATKEVIKEDQQPIEQKTKLKTKPKKKYKYICSICDRGYKSYPKFRRHRDYCHAKECKRKGIKLAPNYQIIDLGNRKVKRYFKKLDYGYFPPVKESIPIVENDSSKKQTKQVPDISVKLNSVPIDKRSESVNPKPMSLIKKKVEQENINLSQPVNKSIKQGSSLLKNNNLINSKTKFKQGSSILKINTNPQKPLSVPNNSLLQPKNQQINSKEASEQNNETQPLSKQTTTRESMIRRSSRISKKYKEQAIQKAKNKRLNNQQQLSEELKKQEIPTKLSNKFKTFNKQSDPDIPELYSNFKCSKCLKLFDEEAIYQTHISTCKGLKFFLRRPIGRSESRSSKKSTNDQVSNKSNNMTRIKLNTEKICRSKSKNKKKQKKSTNIDDTNVLKVDQVLNAITALSTDTIQNAKNQLKDKLKNQPKEQSNIQPTNELKEESKRLKEELKELKVELKEQLKDDEKNQIKNQTNGQDQIKNVLNLAAPTIKICNAKIVKKSKGSSLLGSSLLGSSLLSNRSLIKNDSSLQNEKNKKNESNSNDILKKK